MNKNSTRIADWRKRNPEKHRKIVERERLKRNGIILDEDKEKELAKNRTDEIEKEIFVKLNYNPLLIKNNDKNLQWKLRELNNPLRDDCVRNRSFKKYKVSREWFLNKLLEQDCRCAICKLRIDEIESNLGSRLNIDHNHDTNRVRGLLCGNCNTALGSFKDSIDILESAKQYLLKHSEPMDYQI